MNRLEPVLFRSNLILFEMDRSVFFFQSEFGVRLNDDQVKISGLQVVLDVVHRRVDVKLCVEVTGDEVDRQVVWHRVHDMQVAKTLSRKSLVSFLRNKKSTFKTCSILGNCISRRYF